MSNIVLHLSSEEIKKVKDHYQKYYVKRNAPGIIFSAKLPDVAITIYKSGKVLFQGNGSIREASKFKKEVGKVNTSVSQNRKGDILPKNLESLSVIGSDETGTGDYFGPITVAAVYVPKEKKELLIKLGVRDSKMLTDQKIREIAPIIMSSYTHSVLILRNEKYNKLQQNGYSQGKMKAILHNQALKHVLNKIAPENPDYILIDQFEERTTYYNHLKNENEIVTNNVLFSTKAEQLHVSVASASIIARYAFLKEMDKLSEFIGIELQKGASKKVDEMAASIWHKHGENVLRSISKWHFANTKKAKALMDLK